MQADLTKTDTHRWKRMVIHCCLATKTIENKQRRWLHAKGETLIWVGTIAFKDKAGPGWKQALGLERREEMPLQAILADWARKGRSIQQLLLAPELLRKTKSWLGWPICCTATKNKMDVWPKARGDTEPYKGGNAPAASKSWRKNISNWARNLNKTVPV